MAQVWIPALLRDRTAGQDRIDVPGTYLGEVIEELERRHAGIKARLCEGEAIRPDIAVVIDGEVSRLGWRQPIGLDSEIHFVPAIGGG